MPKPYFRENPRGSYTVLIALNLIILGAATPSAVMAQAELVFETEERERWHGEDNVYGEFYGHRMAMDGDWMVTTGLFKAVLWEHDPNGWHPRQVIEPGIGRLEDVDISGEIVVFGAPGALYGVAPSVNGKMTIWRRNELDVWEEFAIGHSPPNDLTGYEIHNFGSAVDIDSNTIVVGAPDSRECCQGDVDGPGWVFIYTWDGFGWYMTDWFTSEDDDPWRFFGASVDVENLRLVVGAPRDPDHAGPNQFGAAFVYEGWSDDWSCVVTSGPIFTPDPFTDMNYGRHVANDYGMRMVVAGDDAVKILDGPPLGGDNWDSYSVMLPGRRTSRLTDGVDFDNYRVAYVDSANDEVATIYWEYNQWVVSDTFETQVVTTAPVGVALGDQRGVVGYPYEALAGYNTGAFLAYQELANVMYFDEPLVYGDAMPGDRFGMAIDATTTSGPNAIAIVGAPDDRRGQDDTGAAYLYTYDAFEDEWTKQEKWQPDDLVGDASFGFAVACDGYNRIAAGAPRHRVDGQMIGVVHVRHEGSGETALTPYDPDDPGEPVYPDELFGAALAYEGDTLIVGAPAADGVMGFSGVVYTYHHEDQDNTWELQRRLKLTDSTVMAEFGASVSYDGASGFLLIGSPGDQRDGSEAGAAYVYAYSGGNWTYVARLDPEDISAGDRFGEAVVIEGSLAVVGAPGDDSAAPNGGAVHVFELIGNVWTHVAAFTPDDAEPADGFGQTLALTGNDLFIGAPGVDAGVMDVGATYSYRKFGGLWIAATGRVIHDNPVADDQCGMRIAHVGEMLLAGAEGEDGAADDAGAVIVFDYESRVEVPSPMNPGPNGQPCQSDFEVSFSQWMASPVDPAAYHYYADRVDVSGDTMVVAEQSAETTYINGQGQPQVYNIGAVHVYRRTAIDAWTLEETIFPPEEDVVPQQLVSYFGHSVALDGDLLVVGNWYGNFVHVYERTPGGWTLRTRIYATPESGATFGRYGLDVSASTIMVGADAYADQNVPPAVGAVSFYERIDQNTWGLNAGPLTSSEAYFGQHLGVRVSLDSPAGRAVATGNQNPPGYRSAYVFERVGGVWQEVAILNADPDGATAYFGSTGLAISGNTVVVGDQFYSTGPQQPGAAFVWEYDGSTWNSHPPLIGSNPSFQDHAGASVGIDGDIIVVGAPTAYTVYPGGIRTGAAFIFGRENGIWSERLRLLPGDTAIRSFGHSSSVSGGMVAAGTPSQYGAVVYAHDLACDLPCTGDFNGDGLRDLADYAVLQRDFGRQGVGHENGDADGDGDVDLMDHIEFVSIMGVVCP
ncbi:MAG: hypothetical protein ACYTHJ_19950 [Planctomycetota bacterium]|jgi:hypothetical protein